MAKAKGYAPLFDGQERVLAQGPDQVYRASDGRVIVYEAKGGSSQLGHAYGHPQGSTEWAVESAKRVLRASKASVTERSAAKAILDAAVIGKLEVHVIRTRHVLGEPIAAVLEQASRMTDEASRLARSALDDIVRGAIDASDDVGLAVAKPGAKGALPKVMTIVGVGVDLGFRVKDGVEVENQFASGEITQEQREVKHAKNAAGFVSGWTAAAGAGKAGAILGGAIGGPPGAVIGGIALGVTGYVVGEEVGATVAEWGVNRLHDSGTTIRAAWNWVWGD